MRDTKMPADLFNSKTRALFHSQMRRLRRGRGERTLPYTLEEVRECVRTTLDQNAPCPYCHCTLTLDNLTMDHASPLSRGGEHALRNLVVCCSSCNQAKGAMTDEEFCELLALAEGWEELARKDLLARLRAGGKIYR